jgi:exodeoxyribonuclease X
MASPHFIIMDTETTGVDCETDRLVELAGVTLNDVQFTTLVNPERDIPPEARAIHHISPDEVAYAPGEREALSMFQDRLHPSVPEVPVIYTAHNAKFDRGFIDRIKPVNNLYWVCTMKVAMTLWPDAPKFSNQVLRYWLNLEVSTPPDLFPHRALYDCIVTRAILAKALETHSPRELVEISQNPVLLKWCRMGKHAGKLWADVDSGYLNWVKNNRDDENEIFTAEHHLSRRGGGYKGRR